MLEIRSVRAESNVAIAAHDLDGILASFDDEYHASVSSGALMSSPNEMRVAFAGHFALFEDAIFVRTPDSIEVSTNGVTASEVGTWEGRWTTPEGAYRVGGRYLAHWRRRVDGWRIRSEVFVPLHCEGYGC